MTEQEIRALVREVIARRTPAHAPAPVAEVATRHHPSHGLFVLSPGSDTDGPCVIEPTVTCNHCGYCKSYGH